jgi:hypothetical protein
MKKTRVFIEGSFFCEKCNLEYNGEGICKCGGDIKFLSMHSNRYLTVWTKSRKALENRDTKNEEKKGDINMSLDDNVKKLKELLEQYPEMENPNDFDGELEKRRKVYREIIEEIEKLGNDMEHTWADIAWKNIKSLKTEKKK